MSDITQMTEGEEGVVVEIQGGHGLTDRLEGLGIMPGTKIRKISSQIMRGPVVVQIANTQVAIGYGMARKIIVKRNSSNDPKNRD